MRLDQASEVTGRSAQLTEEGFREVLLKEEQRDMEDYMQRVAQER